MSATEQNNHGTERRDQQARQSDSGRPGHRNRPEDWQAAEEAAKSGFSGADARGHGTRPNGRFRRGDRARDRKEGHGGPSSGFRDRHARPPRAPEDREQDGQRFQGQGREDLRDSRPDNRGNRPRRDREESVDNWQDRRKDKPKQDARHGDARYAGRRDRDEWQGRGHVRDRRNNSDFSDNRPDSRRDRQARQDWQERGRDTLRGEGADSRPRTRTGSDRDFRADGRNGLRSRARFSDRFPARPGERGHSGPGSRPDGRLDGRSDGRRDNRATGRDSENRSFDRERSRRPGHAERREHAERRFQDRGPCQDGLGKSPGQDGQVPGRGSGKFRPDRQPARQKDRRTGRQDRALGQDTSHGAYALARQPEDFVRPGDWGYEAEDKSRKAMLRQRSGLTDVIILGAGAAGLMCAAHLVELGLSVCVLDRSRTPGRKLALAGGGRANFSNRDMGPGHYVCGQEGFVEPVLAKMGTDAMVRTMELLGLGCEEREKGKLFLTSPGADLARALLARCRRGDFTLLLGEHLREDCVRPEEERVMVRSQGARLAARHVVLALGSPACPASGATGLGYAMAQHLGHNVIPPRAALTPLTLASDSPWLALSGVSLPVKLTVCDKTISDDMLFTRTGLSGPAILKASLYWQEGEALEIDLLPHELHGLFGDENGKRTPRSVLSRLMPQRLADVLLPADLANRRCAELSRDMRESLEERVHCLKIVPVARAGLRQAEVCLGGVDCAQIEPVTFTSRLENRVSIIGEMLDVTGLLGGYNLHWAFASALLCADAVAKGLYRLRRS